MANEIYSVPKYNRIRGGLNCPFTKPATFKVVESPTGLAETYTVETGREEIPAEDGRPALFRYHCFVELVDEGQSPTRLYLPPKVVDAILRQRQSLSKSGRLAKAKAIARARKERGELPGFMKRRAV